MIETAKKLRLRTPASHSVVSFYVHGPSGGISAKTFNASAIIQAIQAGLPMEELDVLGQSLKLSRSMLAQKLGISKATLQRRIPKGRLAAAESDRLVRFARLMGKAIEVFGTGDNARRWLESPQFGLGGAVPMDYADTEVGAREVEDLLGRVEYGVYS